MRFDRLILIAGWVATAGAAATAWSAGNANLRDDGIGTHLLSALVCAMGMLLPHLWIAIYLLGLRRVEFAGGARLVERAELMRCLPVLLVAVGTVVAAMVTGVYSYSSGGAPWHRTIAWMALAVQPVALWWEGRTLAGNARRLEAV